MASPMVIPTTPQRKTIRKVRKVIIPLILLIYSELQSTML